MRGFGKSYDDEYLELYEYLTQTWCMKPTYAKPFLTSYKKSIGKLFSRARDQMSEHNQSSDPETRLLSFAATGDEYDLSLVAQAYRGYMDDLRRGQHVGTRVEKAIWAVLVNRSDLLEGFDRAFAMYIDEKHDEKMPGVIREVFDLES